MKPLRDIPGPPLRLSEIVNVSINALLTKTAEVDYTHVLQENIEIPDLSFWQGHVNWDLMSENTKNAIIRAGQGVWQDIRFKYNWLNAKIRNVRRAVYWFYDGRFRPADQANILINLIQEDLPELGIWFDWEANYNARYDGLRNVVNMMQLVEAKFRNTSLGMYTTYSFFISNSNVLKHRKEYKYLRDKQLWLAHWTKWAIKLKIPYPWLEGRLELHQFGTPVVGRKFGCGSEELDMSRVMNNFHLYRDKELS